MSALKNLLFPRDSTNIVDIETQKTNKPDASELYQLFPNHQNTLRRRFSENFYKCMDIHRRPRLVKKNGELNIHTENVPKRKRRLWSDMFNTILDIKWRYHFGIFFFSFVISWFLFAFIWYMIAWLHGDLNHIEYQSTASSFNLTNNNHMINNNTAVHIHEMVNEQNEHKVCVQGIHDFTTALLYSVETQHTIGYGLRYITEECSFAIVFLMLQSCFGIFVQGMVAGVVFAKISRPNKRKRTIIFSHNACVSERDGKLSFMFKVANIRISQLSDARVKVHMIKSRRTTEGEFIPFQSYDMKVGHDWSGNDSIFFPWPKTIEHVIDENSPLYEMCKQAANNSMPMRKRSTKFDSEATSNTNSTFLSSATSSGGGSAGDSARPIKSEDYEIVVILEGNIETTGASCHIRTSYLPQEILFGYRFTPIYPKFTDFEYLFDYAKFDHVEPIQYDLLGLNVAFTNKGFNYVYDARHESKNFYLTVQNTEQLPLDFNFKKPVNTTAENSIFSLLKTFGVNNNAAADDIKMNDPVNEHLITFEQKNDVTAISEQRIHPIVEVTKPLKTGRFTIQAVNQSQSESTEPVKKAPAVCQLEQTQPERRQNKSHFLKKTRSQIYKQNFSKHVLFHMHSNAGSLNSLKRSHSRTGSLPLEKKLSRRLLRDTVEPNEKSNSLSETPNRKFD